MKKMIFAGVLGALLSCIAATGAPLNIVALNLEWFPGQDTQSTPDAMAAHKAHARDALEVLAPDLLIATEICEPDALREAISGIEGLQLHVVSDFKDAEADPTRRNQQIAIASKLPAVAGWSEAWQPTMEGLRRGFTFAALLNPATKKLILVYGLHLKSNKSDTPQEAEQNYAIRDASVRQLIDHMRKMEEQFSSQGIEGWIIGGDINTNHDGEYRDHVVEMITAEGFVNTWSTVPKEERRTWKGRVDRFAPSTLDYIFVKGFGEPAAKLYIVPQKVSDHNAVILNIALPQSP